MNINKILIIVTSVLTILMLIFQIIIICELKGVFEEIDNIECDVKVEYIQVEIKENDNKIVESKTIMENNENKEKKLGNFRLTAYCSCYKCCGDYALNRPVDENGNEIVYGSIGEVLKEGYSIAVDPNIIPYGTEVIIDGKTYKAQDCGGAIDGNEIDVYFADHDKASDFAVQYKDVYLKG